MPYHGASWEDVKNLRTADVYFHRTVEALQRLGRADAEVTMEVTTGGLPDSRAFAILCGLDEMLSLFDNTDVRVRSLPEGHAFPARDIHGHRVPVIEIKGPYGQIGAAETPLLGFLCQASGVATRAAHLRLAAGERTLMSFGARRAHPGAAAAIDRAAYVGGCDGVSTIAGAEAAGIAPSGTMPHALVMLAGSLEEALKAFDASAPPQQPRIALVDTFGDEREQALAAARTLGPRLYGVRLDTPASRRGDLLAIARETRYALDREGFGHVRIVASGGLDESEVRRLSPAVDAFGIGTYLSAAPPVDFSLDIVEIDGVPVAKRDRLPGRKVLGWCPRCVLMVVHASRAQCPTCHSELPDARTLERAPGRPEPRVEAAESRSRALAQSHRHAEVGR